MTPREPKRPHVFVMRQSPHERRDLDKLAKMRKMSASDLVRALVRNETYHPLQWVERACETCGRPFHFRADVLPPYHCTLHELRPAKVLPLRKAKR